MKPGDVPPVEKLEVLYLKMSMLYRKDRAAFTAARLEAQKNYNFHRLFDRDEIEAFVRTGKLTFDE